MDKNSVKKSSAEKVREEETILNRVYGWMGGGLLLECLILLLNRYWVNYTYGELDFRLALGVVVKIFAVAGLVGAGASAFWWYKARKQGMGSVWPGVLSLGLLGIALSCIVAWRFAASGLRFLLVAVPVVVLLAMVYYLYQREFFLTAVQGALVLMGTWMGSKGTGGSHGILVYGYTVVALVLILGSVYFGWKAQKDEGQISFRGKKIQLFSQDVNYTLLFVGAAVLALVLILAALSISSVILYSVTVAWVLIMAVYYTVKLM